MSKDYFWREILVFISLHTNLHSKQQWADNYVNTTNLMLKNINVAMCHSMSIFPAIFNADPSFICLFIGSNSVLSWIKKSNKQKLAGFKASIQLIEYQYSLLLVNHWHKQNKSKVANIMWLAKPTQLQKISQVTTIANDWITFFMKCLKQFYLGIAMYALINDFKSPWCFSPSVIHTKLVCSYSTSV